ncbi:MAG: lysozyme inhibitor LprI family protein [Pseudomonadota bacterium]
MRYLLLVIFVMMSSNSIAEDKIETYCEGAQTQLALNECSSKAAKESEEELEKIYNTAIQQLQKYNQSAKEELFIETHKIWTEYVLMNCEVEAGKRQDSGSIWPYLMNSCSARMNHQRIKEIKTTISIEEE